MFLRLVAKYTRDNSRLNPRTTVISLAFEIVPVLLHEKDLLSKNKILFSD